MGLPAVTSKPEDRVAIAHLGQALKTALADEKGPVRAFLNGDPQSRRAIERDLEPAAVDDLLRFGIAEQTEDLLRPRFQAQLIGPHLVFSDLRQSMRVVRKTEERNAYVDPMWEGPTLSNLLVREPAESGLDMGCGCGVIALAMSTYCRRVVALDMNPRALMLARFNMALNGVDNVEVLESDLFSAVEGATFDRIVFNAPVGMELLPRNALESGEQILIRFFSALSKHLKSGGMLHMNVCVKEWSRASFATNLRAWLGENQKDFQSLFIELWRVERGLKFKVRRWIAPFVLPRQYGRLLHIRRGLLIAERNGVARHAETASAYDTWATSLGPRFGASLVKSLMGTDPGKAPAGPSTAVLNTLDDDHRPLGGSVTTAIFNKLQNVPAAALL
ncbi:precorrin-6B methylase 2 [Ensifer adhaerens]|uniref:Precorrin-6B methylase 2 n=1 Tax=Ensifer adhaerens TaxID=106592 RepID=A0ACC5SVK2_ENSAD|nr:methyltransferase [Ensifer adhaerens]MBP1872865.1 precorrin-6B methylase 2 [Ensifer adhaerens]